MNKSSKSHFKSKNIPGRMGSSHFCLWRFFGLIRNFKLIFFIVTILAGLGNYLARSQSITPAADGTGTEVTNNGNQMDIRGGKTSKDGANLFHSFEKFGLSQEEIANFLAKPEIQNILGRVVGGDPSVINGLIQVSGSNANLFLFNPAGIVFGNGASLNVPGDFVATTANGIRFGDGWFNAIGNNDYANLIGNPSAFAFTIGQPGSIINTGDLKVADGRSLVLTAGTIVNTGKLSAPSGQLIVAAVPGTNLVRITQPGNLLSLEIPVTPGSSQPQQWTLPVASIPELLTGSDVGQGAALRVNAEGKTELVSGVEIPTKNGTAIVSGKLDVPGTQPGKTGGTVQISGDKVGLVGANINASGSNGGGTVLVGGDYKGQGTVPNAADTYVSKDSAIAVDATSNRPVRNIISESKKW
jgi:filamentous hemagglutinin family protein